MTTLLEILGTPPTRAAVIGGCTRLVDSEVSSKRGLMAIPLKAGYKVVKGFRPGFVGGVVDFLLDEFCQALDPFYQRWHETPVESRPNLTQALVRESDQVAEALLAVTDRRAERSTNRSIVKVYRKLRGTGKRHVIDALPGLGRTIEPHLP